MLTIKTILQMEEKRPFRAALGKLSINDHAIVKRVIIARCKWSPVSFTQKADGERGLTDKNQNKKNEFQVVESTLRCFGINAWTGETI